MRTADQVQVARIDGAATRRCVTDRGFVAWDSPGYPSSPLSRPGSERRSRQSPRTGIGGSLQSARRAADSERGYGVEIALLRQFRRRRRYVAVVHAVASKARKRLCKVPHEFPFPSGRAPCYPGSILPRVAGACAHPMNAHDRPILSLVSGPGQFIIPPFQRPYRWSDEPCLVLLDDVEQAAAGSASGERHFLGSIVHYPRITEFGFTTSLLIDGQQRLTTPGRHLADRRSALNDIVGGSITIPALAGSGGAADRDRSRFAVAART